MNAHLFTKLFIDRHFSSRIFLGQTLSANSVPVRGVQSRHVNH